MVGTSQFFIGGMKWQHAVILESIWQTDSIIIRFPVLANGTPYSSSDLPYFTLLLYLDKINLNLNSSSLSSLDKKNPTSKSTKIFQENFKFCLSQIPIASHRKYSKTISNSVLAKFQSLLIENIVRKSQIMSLLIFSLSAYLFYTLAIGV